MAPVSGLMPAIPVPGRALEAWQPAHRMGLPPEAVAESPEEFDSAWKRVVENWGVVIDRAEMPTEN